MNKKLLVFIYFSAFTLFVEGQITFQKTFGGTGQTEGFCVQQTVDGGYITSGWTNNSGAGFFDIYLIKTDSAGDSLWTRKFGGSDEELSRSVNQTSDGGYLVVGSTLSFDTNRFHLYIIKTDLNGDTLWTKIYGDTTDTRSTSVVQTLDGGFAIVGFTVTLGGTGFDIYLLKIDSNGDTLWTRSFGSLQFDLGYYISQTLDSGFIIAGSTEGFGVGGTDICVLKTDSLGNFLWMKTFGGSNYDDARFVHQTTDGGYLIAGNTNSFGAGGLDVYLIRTDSSGDTLWTKCIGGAKDDCAMACQQTSDGGFIIAGYTDNSPIDTSDVLLIKTDLNGDIVWAKTYGGLGPDWGYSVVQTSDGGYVIGGTKKGFGFGSFLYLIKTDSSGNSGCTQGNITSTVSSTSTHETSITNIQTFSKTFVRPTPTEVFSGTPVNTLCTSVSINNFTEENSFLISPNPTSAQFDIQLSSNYQKAQLEIYNLLGEKIFSAADCRLKTIRPGESVLWQIDCRLFPPGVYFVALQTESGISVQKLIKE